MPNIFIEKDLQERFIEYLVQHDYPKNRIVTEWGDGSFFVDIAIMAEDLVTPLAFFEVKNAISIKEMKHIFERTRAYMKRLGISVPVYIVFPDSKIIGQFEIVDLCEILNSPKTTVEGAENTRSANSPERTISYQTLESGGKSKIAVSKQAQRKKHIDNLKVMCWVFIPFTGTVLIMLDAFNKYVFNKERLLVLGAILIVALLPFFSEITFGDVSVKRKKEDRDK